MCWLSVCLLLLCHCPIHVTHLIITTNTQKHTDCPVHCCRVCVISPIEQGLRTVCTVFNLQQPPTPLPLLLTSPVSCQGNPSFLPSFPFLHLKASIFSPLLPPPFSPLSLSLSLSFAVYPSSSSVSLVFHPPPPPLFCPPLFSHSIFIPCLLMPPFIFPPSLSPFHTLHRLVTCI